MAKISIGKRRVGTPRKPQTITPEALQDFKDTGRKVTEKSGGIVLLDGFRKFQVVGEKKPEKEDTPEKERADPSFEGDFVGQGSVTSDFGITANNKNELTEFV